MNGKEENGIGNPSQRLPFKKSGDKERDELLWEISRLKRDLDWRKSHIEWQEKEFSKIRKTCFCLLFIVFIIGVIAGIIVGKGM